MAKFPQPYYRSQRGTWCVQVRGKQITLGPDKDAAFREYHRMMAGEATPAAAPPSGVLVITVLDAYLDWLEKRVQEGSKAPRTYRWYQRYLQDFIRFKTPNEAIAGLTIDGLEPIHVYQWVDSHPGWKTGKRGAMTSVQRAFNWAARAGLLKSIGGKSPIASLEKPAQGRREQLVSEDDYRDVLTIVGMGPARDLIELSWETGMRPHELFTAEARFFGDGQLTFPIKLSKGRKVQRVVTLSDTGVEIVRRSCLKNPVGPLLRNTEGDPWNGASVNCLFQRIRRELGRRRLPGMGLIPPKIKRLTKAEREQPSVRAEHEKKVLARRKHIHRLSWEHGMKYSLYAFRHAYVTEALVNGIDAVTVSVLAGHRDTTMIARHYAHVAQRPDHMKSAANRARGASAAG